MGSLRLSLSIPGSGAVAIATERHPALMGEGYPLGTRFIWKFGGDTEGMRALRELLGGGPPVLHASEDGGTLTLFTEGNEEERQVVSRGGSAGVLLVPPLVWSAGRLRFNLIVEEGKPLEDLLGIFPGAHLLAKRPLEQDGVLREILSSGPFLPRLTRRQGEALLTALEAGYYDSPRRITTAEGAAALGLARSTFEEHLKRAESQIIQALAPIVRAKLEVGGPGEGAMRAEALHLYARFSEELGLYVEVTLRGERVHRVRLAREPSPVARREGHPYILRILEHLATGRGDLDDIPLDLEVTPFERGVLELLRRVPAGEVVTYGDLARRLGRPRASRAVGNAVAHNPVPIVIPCHRVVPGSGGTGNYSQEGGANTKRRILEREGGLEKVKGLKGSHRGRA